MMSGLPEALAGQDIEDLAYGAGSTDFHLEQGGFGTGWWSSSDDEEEEEDGVCPPPLVVSHDTDLCRSISTTCLVPRTSASPSRRQTTTNPMS